MRRLLFILTIGCLFSLTFLAAPTSNETPQVSKQHQTETKNSENYKFIFKGTPFVKYADNDGVIIVPANYYHHKYEKLRSFGYSLQTWTGSNGKTYRPDNIVTDSIVTRDTLTADVILTPNFVLNEEDLGDATVTALWEFGLPDSVALFSNFQDVFSFVKPTLYNSYYIDMNMKIDATQGWIDNELFHVDLIVAKASQRLLLCSSHLLFKLAVIVNYPDPSSSAACGSLYKHRVAQLICKRMRSVDI